MLATRSCSKVVCSFLQVKIGDFGFTKRLSGKQSSMQVKRITHPRWVAPEVSQQYESGHQCSALCQAGSQVSMECLLCAATSCTPTHGRSRGLDCYCSSHGDNHQVLAVYHYVCPAGSQLLLLSCLFLLQLMTDCRLSAASDVYSFGIIMYEMLTWLLPFHDQSKEQVRQHCRDIQLVSQCQRRLCVCG